MTDTERKLTREELERLLNDPEVAMQPDRVWALLDILAHPASAWPDTGRDEPFHGLHRMTHSMA